METIHLSRNNWIFLILAVMLFSLMSCTKDELEPISSSEMNPNDAIPELRIEPSKYQ